GQTLAIEAQGADAEAAIAGVARSLSAGEAEAPVRAVAVQTIEESAGEIRGVCASPGIAVGVAARVTLADIAVEERGKGADVERAALGAARARVRTRLLGAQGGEKGAILAAHAALVDDPDIGAAAEALIAQGKSAGYAWRAALADLRTRLGALGDSYLAE